MVDEKWHALGVDCSMCKERTTFKVPTVRYFAWVNGEGPSFVQDALPDVSVAHREMLISGACSVCWDKMIEEDEE